jgi:hypothetical protein
LSSALIADSAELVEAPTAKDAALELTALDNDGVIDKLGLTVVTASAAATVEKFSKSNAVNTLRKAFLAMSIMKTTLIK